MGGLKYPAEAPRPFVLTCLFGDQVLTENFNFDVRQAPPLAVAWDGVVGFVADEIGLVVADNHTELRAEARRAATRRSAGRDCRAPPHASRGGRL